MQAQAPSGTARIGAAALAHARLQCSSSGLCYELVSFAGCRAESRATRHKKGTEHPDRERWQFRRRKLSLSRNIKCDTCRGSGTKSGRRYTCEQCHGSGVTVRSLLSQCRQHARSVVMLQAWRQYASASANACADRQYLRTFSDEPDDEPNFGRTQQVQLRPLGPGMMQQIQQPCGVCGQTGYSVPASDKCGSCAGKGLTPEKKVFDVHIEKVRLLHQIRHVHACWLGQEMHAGLACAGQLSSFGALLAWWFILGACFSAASPTASDSSWRNSTSMRVLHKYEHV